MARTALQLTTSQVSFVTTGAAGDLQLVETTAPGTVANTGQIYVKASDHLLYFKNASGTETAIALGAGGLTVGTTTITGGSSGDFLYNNAGVLGSQAGGSTWTFSQTLTWSNETTKTTSALAVHDLWLLLVNLNNLASSGSGTRLSVWMQVNGITAGYNNTFLQAAAIVSDSSQAEFKLSDSGGDGFDTLVGQVIIQGRHNNGLKLLSASLSLQHLGNIALKSYMTGDSNDLTSISIAHSNNSFGNGAGMTGKVDIFYRDL